jgi:signal transduction histidine kinase
VRVTVGLVEAAAEVVDNGVGPEGGNRTTAPNLRVSDLPSWAGNGLSGLAERLRALGGRLELAGRPEGGFRLVASVPTRAPVAAVSR